MKKMLVLTCLLLLATLPIFAGAGTETTSETAATVKGTGEAEQYNADQYEAEFGTRITTFNESPLLKSRVSSGALPSVEERLPVDFAVVTPVDEIGEYGGTAYTYAMGQVYAGGGYHLMGQEGLFTVAGDLASVIPNVAKSYDLPADGRSLTVELREGMKWSDGEPFGADDFMFWYNDMMLNEDLTSNPPSRFSPGGEFFGLRKIDDLTLRFTFSAPFAHVLTYFGLLGGAQNGLFLPAHYLKQYHADYADASSLDDMIKEGGFDNWVQLYRNKQRSQDVRGNATNMEGPYVHTYVPIDLTTDTVAYERNPYYWKVDPAGNQLPYIDTVQVSLVENKELLNVKIVAGEATIAAWFTDIANYSLYQDNASSGNYRVLMWNTSNSTDTAYFPNYTHTDPVMRSINQDKRFRHALSLAIDREEINDAIFFGRGTILQPTALPGTRFYKESYAKAYTEYDVAEANRLLDDMGLEWDSQKKWRLRPDGETLAYTVIAGPAEGPVQRVSEIVIQQWEQIGVKATYNLQDWGLTHSFHQTGGADMFAFLVDKSTEYGLVSDGRGISWFDFSDGNRYFTSVLLPGGNQNYDFPAEFPTSEYPFSEILRLKKLSTELEQTLDESKRAEIIDEIFKSQAENLWVIGTVYGPKPIVIASNLKNVRDVGVWGDGLKHMSAYHPEQMFLEQ